MTDEKTRPVDLQHSAHDPDEPAADTSLKHLDGLSFADRVQMLLKAAEEAGLNVGVVEGRRDLKRQQWLYENGLSAHDGRERKSAHQLGTAVDIAFLDEDGAFSWSQDHDWHSLARLAEAVGLSWGGRWSQPVLSHFQREDPFAIVALQHHHRFGGMVAAGTSCGGACSNCSTEILFTHRR